MDFDLIIVGGGAAGIMTAVSAKRAKPNISVAIIDRTFALGRKILVCGAGRCNITNVNLSNDAAKRYYGADPKFVKAVFDQFGYQQIVDFFNELGVELYLERKTKVGKLFPITDQAKTVTAVLEDELAQLGVKVFLNTEVLAINPFPNKYFEIKTQLVSTNEIMNFTANKLVLSAGGKTYPALGSNGSGYELARSLQHTVIDPVPSALPLEGKNQLSQLLQGVRVEASATSVIDGVEIKTSVDDVMFTQYGLSGPAILNISREISIALNRLRQGKCQVRLNLLPEKDVLRTLNTRWSKRPQQKVIISLYGLLANKVAEAVVTLAKINSEKKVSELTYEEKGRLVQILTTYTVDISATRGWNEAEFTAGGVDTAEVDPNTLQSLKTANLYFCGEILNVDGDVGGYNLSWAWSSGWVVGKSV